MGAGRCLSLAGCQAFDINDFTGLAPVTDDSGDARLMSRMFPPTKTPARWLVPVAVIAACAWAHPAAAQDASNWSNFSLAEEMNPSDASDLDAANTYRPPYRARTPQDDEDIAAREAAEQGGEILPDPRAELEYAPLPSAPVVKEVEIIGASDEDHKKAMRVLQTRSGEPLDPLRQREDIRRLYEMGLFSPNIQAQAVNVSGGVKLQYVVEPNPKVRSISVVGNTKVTTAKILDELPVKEGQVYTNQAQNKIQDNISRYYTEKGYAEAVVRVEERPGPGNSVDLAIAVDEGTRMQVRDLIIRGNDTLRDLPIKLRVTNKGSFGPFKHYYNETKFQEDLEVVRAHYLSKGYLDAQVNRGDFIYAQDQSWVSPVIDIQEGPRYRIGRLEARGYTLFDREEVLGAFRGLQGEFFDGKKIAEASKRVENMYGDEGFLHSKVNSDTHRDPTRGMVDLDVEVSEGQRIYVGDVKILAQTYPDDMEMGYLRRFYSRFSPPVRDEVVQREVQMRPGQVYRRYEEVRTRERLKSLNVFEEVDIREQLSSDPNVRDMVVEVTQGNTGNLIFGAGFGDVEGGFVYANYVERNLFGMARDLRVSALLGTNATNLSLSYTDRYFMGTDIAAKFDLFHRNFRRTGRFDETRFGTMAEFTRPLNECLKDAVRLRLESVAYEFDSGSEPKEKIRDYVAATVRYKLTRDTRNDRFFPTEGTMLSGGLEVGAADGFLAKFEGQAAGYWALSDNLVFANNTMVGLMPYSANNIGYGERFFLGGSQDMRGFKLYGAGPHDSDNDKIPLGGSTKLLSQFELRRQFTENIAGLVFTDVGFIGEGALDPGSPRVSMGTGVRLGLPIARVALDLGVPVMSQSQDQTQLFHFSITSAF